LNRVLITGGAGFIGSHVADRFIKDGAEVTIVDNLSTGDRRNLPKDARFVEADIRDMKVEELFANERFDIMIHHAAQIDVRVSVRDPLSDLLVNIAGSVGLMEHCQRSGVRQIIFASTGGAIYGEQDYFPADEKHPARPISPYGVAKLAVERYLYYYHIQYGINVVCLRYANVYGPRQNPHGEAGVVAIFSERMLKGVATYINGDGLQTRDYVFVGDVAEANIRAARLDGFHIFNIGTAIETDVVALYEHLNQLTGGKTIRQHRPPAEGEQRRSVIDYSLAYKTLGWAPAVTLSDGLARTVDFFRVREANIL